MKEYQNIFVPSHGRKDPKILELLDKDEKLIINLCVRQEAIDEGFYNHIDNERVNVISLGYGITDIGETRQAIIEHAIKHDIEFLPMIDDTIYNMTDLTKYKTKLTITEMLRHMIFLMQNDKHSEHVVGYSIPKYEALYANGATRILIDTYEEHDYYSFFPVQAYILNINQIVNNNITYKSYNKFGFEDANFLVDCLKAGLIFIDRPYFAISAMVPNEPKIGGTHDDMNEDLEKRYDEKSKLSLKYVGNMMGVGIEKRYRRYMNAYIAFFVVKFDFFREVLTTQRKNNQRLIDKQFMLDELWLKGEDNDS